MFALLTVSTVCFAGAVGGPKSKRDTVMPGKTDVYTIVFEGEEPAKIEVIGDGASDIDCYLFDNNGGLIRSDTDFTDTCLLQWTPAWTGKFSLRIVNTGKRPNEYRLNTN